MTPACHGCPWWLLPSVGRRRGLVGPARSGGHAGHPRHLGAGCALPVGRGLRAAGQPGCSGRRPVFRAPRPHPFAADPGVLGDALGLLGEGPRDLASKAAADELSLWLPSAGPGPGCAPELIRPADLDGDERGGKRGAGRGRRAALGCWRVPALAFGPAAALTLLAALDPVDSPPAAAAHPDLIAGGSAVYWAAVARFAADLCARGRILPVLGRAGDGAAGLGSAGGPGSAADGPGCWPGVGWPLRARRPGSGGGSSAGSGLGRGLAPGADRPGRPAGRRAGRGDAAGVPRGRARRPAARAVAGRGAGCAGRRGRAGPAGRVRGPGPAAAWAARREPGAAQQVLSGGRQPHWSLLPPRRGAGPPASRSPSAGRPR